jgi:MFS family permease
LASIAKVFYYIPYHYYNVKYTEGKQRGKQMAVVNSTILFLSVLTPLIGGVVTEKWGLSGVGLITIIFAFLSIIPLFKIDDYRFHLSKNMMELLNQPDMQQTLKMLAITEFQSKETFWQLYIFIFIGSSFSEFGLLMTIVTLLTIPLLLFFGKFSDHHNKKWFIQIQGVVTSLLWFSRLLLTTVFQVVFVDMLNKVNYNIRNQTISIVLYDLAVKDKQEVLLDEKLIIREAFDNLALGLSLLSGVFIVYFFGFPGVFVFAGIVALLFTRV